MLQSEAKRDDMEVDANAKVDGHLDNWIHKCDLIANPSI